jgi:hypothetical protein
MTSIPKIDQLLRELEQNNFYGAVELKFEAGRLILIRKTENIKPQDCRDNRGEHGAHR